MVIQPELLKISAALTTQVAKKSSVAIWDKIKASKQKGEDKETINSLEDIVSDLIEDKNELIQIAQAYEEELLTQKLSEDEIDYVTNSIIPIIEELIDESPSGEASQVQESINLIKPLLSKETFNILQLMGFNFKKSIGEPLTDLINAYIKANVPVSPTLNIELATLQERKEIELLKLLQDGEAYERYKEVLNID